MSILRFHISGMNRPVLLRRIVWQLSLIGFVVYVSKKYQIPGFTPPEIKMNEYRSNQEQSERKKKEIETTILKRGTKVVAERCSQNTRSCYLIEDTPLVEEKGVVVRRSMVLKSNQEYAHTIVELKKPSELSWQNFNSRHWQVNKYIVVSRYCKLMVAIGFVMEALSLDPEVSQQVLMIGLGGGQINNFFSAAKYLKIKSTVVEIDPEMVVLARDWFGHEDNNDTTIIIENGLIFIEKAVKKRKTYKLILLDACYSDRRPIICPVEEFLVEATVNTLASILDENGVFAMNILSIRDSFVHEENVLRIYEKHFKTCFLLKYHPEKRMLICSHRHRWSLDEQKKIFQKNIIDFETRFNINISQLVMIN